MRLIFFFLAFTNIVLFVWGHFFIVESHAVEAEESPSSDIRQFTGDNKARERNTIQGGAGEQDSPSTTLVKEIVDVQPLCKIVGPFPGAEEAGQLIERLGAMSIGASQHELELRVGVNYWLYLPPVSSRKEALRTLAELQGQKIDSYVIPRGELANGISLGMFTQKDLADQQLKEIISKGWSPTLKEVDRTQVEIWVMVNHQDGQKMSNLTWERVMEGFNLQEQRENYCLDVAS